VRTVARPGPRAAAGLVLAAVLGACGGGSGDDVPTLPTVPPTVTPTTVAAEAVPPSTVAPEARTGSPTTARSAGGSDRGTTDTPTAPAGPAALAPAAPGTYRYDTAGTTTLGLSTLPYPAVTTLTVDPPAGTRQHWTRDLRDPAGNGPLLELSLDYRAAGVFLEGLRLTTSVSGFSNVQDLRPTSPTLLLPTGAGPGTRQELDLAGTASTARLVLEVQGRERLTIAGRAVDTLVVHLVATLPPGEITGTLDLTAWLAPSVGPWVKERSVTDASAGGGLARFQSRYEATIQRLP
jgi:hypothetical protein